MPRFEILLVEDDAGTRSFIAEVMEEGGFSVRAVETIAEAKDRLESQAFDMLLFDRSLPDGDGLELCAELRAQPKYRDIPVLFLTAKSSVEEKVEGLRGGGDDYLPKPFEAVELLARIEALLRRSGRMGQPEVLEAGELRLDFDSRKAYAKKKELGLWAKEFDLLALLMSQSGRVVSRDFLLQRLWGYSADDKPNTKVVDITISHLRDKMGALGKKIVTVRGFGYRLDV